MKYNVDYITFEVQARLMKIITKPVQRNFKIRRRFPEGKVSTYVYNILLILSCNPAPFFNYQPNFYRHARQDY